MFKKSICLIMTLLITIAFVACGNGQKAQQNDSTYNTSTQKNTEKNVSETTKEVSIEMWSFHTPGSPLSQAYENIIKEFQDKNPNIKIALEFVGDDITQKLRPRFAQGDTPDIIENNSSSICTFAKEGLMYSLDEDLKSRDYDNKDIWENAFVKGTLDTGIVNGKKYIIPDSSVIAAWFYNKELFKKYSLNEPKNWSDFLNVCKVLKDNGVAAIGMDGDFDYFTAFYFTNLSVRIAGYDKYISAISGKDGVSWEDPAFLEAAKKTKEIIPYFIENFKGMQYPAANAMFVQGKAAMMYVGSWIPSELAEIMPEGFEIGFFPFPVIEGQAETKTIIEIKTNGWGIPNSAKSKQEAVNILKYISKQESAKKLVGANICPAVKDVEPPEVLKNVPNLINAADITVPIYLYLYDREYTEWASKSLLPLNTKFMFGEIKEPEDFLKQLEASSKTYYKK